MTDRNVYDSIIIGAGLCGSNAARTQAFMAAQEEEQHNILVLEASDGPGGRFSTRTVKKKTVEIPAADTDGIAVDNGANSVPEAVFQMEAPHYNSFFDSAINGSLLVPWHGVQTPLYVPTLGGTLSRQAYYVNPRFMTDLIPAETLGINGICAWNLTRFQSQVSYMGKSRVTSVQPNEDGTWTVIAQVGPAQQPSEMEFVAVNILFALPLHMAYKICQGNLPTAERAGVKYAPLFTMIVQCEGALFTQPMLTLDNDDNIASIIHEGTKRPEANGIYVVHSSAGLAERVVWRNRTDKIAQAREATREMLNSLSALPAFHEREIHIIDRHISANRWLSHQPFKFSVPLNLSAGLFATGDWQRKVNLEGLTPSMLAIENGGEMGERLYAAKNRLNV